MTTASKDTGHDCGCQKDHRPPPLALQSHHIWPLFLGGPEDGEQIWLCPTTHVNVHELLRRMLLNGLLEYRECRTEEDRPVSLHAWQLAVRGYQTWLKATNGTHGYVLADPPESR